MFKRVYVKKIGNNNKLLQTCPPSHLLQKFLRTTYMVGRAEIALSLVYRYYRNGRTFIIHALQFLKQTFDYNKNRVSAFAVEKMVLKDISE